MQVCSNEGPCPFSRGDNYEIAKNTLTNFKNLLLHNHWANFNKIWHKSSLGKGIKNCSNEGPGPFRRGYNLEIVKIHWWNLKITFSRTSEPISTFCTKFKNLLPNYWANFIVYNHNFVQMYSLICTGFSVERCGPVASCLFNFRRVNVLILPCSDLKFTLKTIILLKYLISI